MASTSSPTFHSLAFTDIPEPDWADVIVTALPLAAPVDPRVWAQEIFSLRDCPRVVLALLTVRQLAVRLIGLPPSDVSVFEVRGVVGDEALLAADEKHLDLRCGVGVDSDSRLLRVTTAVRLKGWRGRLYFGPVALLHGPVTRAMMRSAARRLEQRGASPLA